MPRIIKTVQSQPKPERLLNVAAYARVSSGKDAMLRFLSAQVSFYSCMIQSHKGWNYVGVYSDDYVIIGISERNPIKSRVSTLIPFSFFGKDRAYFIKSQNST